MYSSNESSAKSCPINFIKVSCESSKSMTIDLVQCLQSLKNIEYSLFLSRVWLNKKNVWYHNWYIYLFHKPTIKSSTINFVEITFSNESAPVIAMPDFVKVPFRINSNGKCREINIIYIVLKLFWNEVVQLITSTCTYMYH